MPGHLDLRRPRCGAVIGHWGSFTKPDAALMDRPGTISRWSRLTQNRQRPHLSTALKLPIVAVNDVHTTAQIAKAAEHCELFG